MRREVSIAIAALVLGAGAAAPARADTSTHYQFRGLNAHASFTGSDECGMFDVQVSAGESVTHESGGRPITAALAYAWVIAMNHCTQEHFFGWGQIDRAELRGLEAASLAVPLEVHGSRCHEGPEGFTCEEITETAILGVELTGEGDLTQGISIIHQSAGRYRTSSRASGSERAASVTASLVIGGVERLAGAEVQRAILARSATSSHWFHRDGEGGGR